MEELKTIIQEKIAEVAFKRVGFDESLIQSKLLDSITVVDLIVSIEEVLRQSIPSWQLFRKSKRFHGQCCSLSLPFSDSSFCPLPV
jgi:acyl carrier protein